MFNILLIDGDFDFETVEGHAPTYADAVDMAEWIAREHGFGDSPEIGADLERYGSVSAYPLIVRIVNA